MKKYPPKVTFVCSAHGLQGFSAFSGHARLVLKCGCVWYANGDGLAFDCSLPYKDRWWEQTDEERIKYSHCAAYGCKRKVVARWDLDYWCAKDLARVKKLRREDARWHR